jgi:hypothetical protein
MRVAKFFITFLLCALVQASSLYTQEELDQHVRELYEQRASAGSQTGMTILMNILNQALKDGERTA